jgi:hypothetical protein
LETWDWSFWLWGEQLFCWGEGGVRVFSMTHLSN